MTSSTTRLRLQSLELRLGALVDEYHKNDETLINTLDPVARRKLERQSDVLLAEMERIEKQITRLRRSGQEQPDAAAPRTERRAPQTQPRWDQYLHLIDFQRVVNSFETTIWPPAYLRQRTAMLLFQNGRQMCGDLLVQRLRERITELIQRKQHASLHLHEVVFTAGKALSPDGLLAELGKGLGVTPLPADPIPAIVARLLRPLQMNSVLLLAVRVLGETDDRAAAFAAFAPWFAGTFWPALRQALADSQASLPYARAAAAIVIDLPSPPAHVDHTLCCPPDQFHDQRLIKLPLSNWQLDEIISWLADYSALAEQPDQIEHEARGVFANSGGGTPMLVRYELSRILQ